MVTVTQERKITGGDKKTAKERIEVMPLDVQDSALLLPVSCAKS